MTRSKFVIRWILGHLKIKPKLFSHPRSAISFTNAEMVKKISGKKVVRQDNIENYRKALSKRKFVHEGAMACSGKLGKNKGKGKFKGGLNSILKNPYAGTVAKFVFTAVLTYGTIYMGVWGTPAETRNLFHKFGRKVHDNKHAGGHHAKQKDHQEHKEHHEHKDHHEHKEPHEHHDGHHAESGVHHTINEENLPDLHAGHEDHQVINEDHQVKIEDHQATDSQVKDSQTKDDQAKDYKQNYPDPQFDI